MGLRLEYLLIFIIIVTIGVTTMIKLTNTTQNANAISKELTFNDTTFIEVNTKEMLARSFSTQGIRETGILYLEHLNYHTNNIELLLANSGRYENETLYLDGNVSLFEKKGFKYETEHAIYNQRTEILEITSPFTVHMNNNIIKGDKLQYNAMKKEVNATHVDAVIYTSKK
jgi:hypothetical protein